MIERFARYPYTPLCVNWAYLDKKKLISSWTSSYSFGIKQSRSEPSMRLGMRAMNMRYIITPADMEAKCCASKWEYRLM